MLIIGAAPGTILLRMHRMGISGMRARAHSLAEEGNEGKKGRPRPHGSSRVDFRSIFRFSPAWRLSTKVNEKWVEVFACCNSVQFTLKAIVEVIDHRKSWLFSN
jgi:hypothetical protein